MRPEPAGLDLQAIPISTVDFRAMHRGQQFGWRYAASHLRCRGGPGRRADHQIGGLCHIDPSFGQSCDDTDRPCMSGGPTTTENQSNVVNHLPTIAARGHSCPSRYQDRASRPVSRLFTSRVQLRPEPAGLEDPAGEYGTTGLESLAVHDGAQHVEPAELAQVRAGEGSIRQVEVSGWVA